MAENTTYIVLIHRNALHQFGAQTLIYYVPRWSLENVENLTSEHGDFHVYFIVI